MKHVVIVESPAKCKTIHKYLGPDYTVLASYGHIRDLPSKEGSVRPDEDFAIDYQISSDSKKHIDEMVKAVKGADSLILATDPDREGEAISWHVLEVLKEKKAINDNTDVKRISFNSITKKAVQEAMENPRELDMDLVNAQQARRALDYLVGFTLSPVLWRKLPGSKSAGRVQSVALRIICDREVEIEKFITNEFWTIEADFKNDKGDTFTAKLTHVDGEKLEKLSIGDEKTAKEITKNLADKSYKITKVERKEVKRRPYAPFTTSTIQQAASSRLGFSTSKTMQVAQKLYEGIDIGGEVAGLITYMRTDGVTVTPEAIDQARDVIGQIFGNEYLPEKHNFYKSKAKLAQEAHEAIRPTDPATKPDDIKQHLSDEQFKLYDLIWKRFMASQMKDKILDQVSAHIVSDDNAVEFKSVGSTVKFDGFSKVYGESKKKDEDDEKVLPPLNENTVADFISENAEQHFTQPPPRYGEASLVKKLEELGIGRPSTYSSIISVLQSREYVILDKKRFIPEMKGMIVTAFLRTFFTQYVEYDFTAKLEENLDHIAAGDLSWKDELRTFWNEFHPLVESVMEVEFTQVIDELDKLLEPILFSGEGDLEEKKKCPKCDNGIAGLKLGKFGAFLGCSNYPECKYTKQLIHMEDAHDDGSEAADGPKVLGIDDKTGMEISLRKGPYGYYIQLGEQVEKEKPRRSPLPKGTAPEDVDLEKAMSLLSLPRIVGEHPETGKPIEAAIGRYGPYLKHDGKFVSLKGDDDVLTVGINRAVDLIAQNKKATGSEPIRDLGEHPSDGEKVGVYVGRYGPYVKHKKLNASIPKAMDQETITLEEAVDLLEKQAAKKKEKKKK